ncbi:MAG: HAMP domain-containing sensor histidine kinase [Candidatus Omnitrophota bacterium]
MTLVGLNVDIETIKDGLKLFLVFLPLLYFYFKGIDIIVRDIRLAMFVGGFSILLVGLFTDFAGDVSMFNGVPFIGGDYPFHEQLETILGTVGFLLFAIGIAMEIDYIKNVTNEKQKMIQKLQGQTEQLKKFDQLKTKFIQDLSHEFQSPLTNIRLSLHNIIEGLMGEVSESQKGTLEIGRRNVERLNRLSSDILSLSQIESGKFPFHGATHNLRSLAQEAYLSLKSLFDKKSISFKLTNLLTDSKIWCDGDEIIQVFVNLFSNAIKYSPAKTQISVKLSQEEQNVRVEIEDQGPGIAREDLEKLFNRFERVDQQKESGTGLGLAISKEIISLHKGRIWAESTIGEGTRMIFILPTHA